MAPYPTCTVLIATYNWHEALNLCVRSLWNQSVLPQEIIICDDGSGEETALSIKLLQQKSPVPIRHVWQEDNGYQAASAINKGAAIAASDYLIQTDADMILHRHFVKDHLTHAKSKVFYCGNRYNISEEISESILQSGDFKVPARLIVSRNMRKRWRVKFLQKISIELYKIKDMHTYVASCNLAYWKKDFLSVNGYDENFTGWGFEDIEYALRLMNNGIELKFIRFGAIGFHLYHNMTSRHNANNNYKKALETYKTKKLKCEVGVEQYL